LLAQAHLHACHGTDSKIVGPSWREIAASTAAAPMPRPTWPARSSPVAGRVGAIPMPPQSLPDADAKLIAQWLADGARK
jgi:cytochrome c551/c552